MKRFEVMMLSRVVPDTHPVPKTLMEAAQEAGEGTWVCTKATVQDTGKLHVSFRDAQELLLADVFREHVTEVLRG